MPGLFCWAACLLDSIANRQLRLPLARDFQRGHQTGGDPAKASPAGRKAMRRALLIVGFLALAMGLLWIGQGTGVVAWPKSSFMINEIQWALYGAMLASVGLIFIWQSQR
jgi:hypothetical protein